MKRLENKICAKEMGEIGRFVKEKETEAEHEGASHTVIPTLQVQAVKDKPIVTDPAAQKKVGVAGLLSW